MAKDVYYVVKAKFYGNMTHDKGFYYTYYDDVNDPADAEEANATFSTKYFAATFLEPKNAKQLFPCFDGGFLGKLSKNENFYKIFALQITFFEHRLMSPCHDVKT